MAGKDERRQGVLTALDTAAKSLHDLVDAERSGASGGVELLERVIAYVASVVEQTDGELLTDSAITAIVSHADGIAEDPVTTAGNARTYADAMLTGVALLPIARDRTVEQSVREAAANFQRSARHRLNAIETEAEQGAERIQSSLTTLREQVAELSASSSTEIASQVTAFEAKIAEYEATIAAQQQRLDAMVERQSASFSETQEERATSFADELAVAKGTFAEALKEAQKTVDDRVSEIRRMEEESSGLVHSIGLGGTAERYGDEAKVQKKVADTFRWITIWLALGAVGMAVFAVVHHVQDNSVVLAKLAVSAVLGGLATYTARQSGRHRKREERARNLQLELTAFAPFIEPLPAEVKEFERVLMTRKTFGNIAALPGGDDADHVYGPLGPVLGLIQRKIGGGITIDDA